MKLNETIEFHIKTTSLALSRMYNKVAERYGITQTIGYILVFVEREGTPSTRLAQLLGMKNSSLTRLLKNMEKSGCIYRKVDEKDKRIVRVFLTEEGVRKRKIAKEAVLSFNEKLLNKVSKQELDTFYKVFDIIRNQVDEEISKNEK
jgi:DNA-binding MarR family transcriptional regulator